VRVAGSLASGLIGAVALAQSAAGPTAPAAAPGSSAAPASAARSSAVVVPRSERGQWYYAGRYGVDHLQVRSISSGISLEFRYRVLNPGKAQALGDKRSKPAMVDWKTGTRLTVPTMEKIGQLRQQVTQLEQGREYWMVFANPGKLVKPGDRVDVVVGAIRLEGLVVE
jgi:hypothetical protein